MASSVFDRETLLDLTVNVIPLGILAFFVVLFAVVNPFGWSGTYSVLQYAIVITTFALLTILTYYSGKAIAEDEHRREAEGTLDEELGPGQPTPEEFGVAEEAEAEDEAETADEAETEGELEAGAEAATEAGADESAEEADAEEAEA